MNVVVDASIALDLFECASGATKYQRRNKVTVTPAQTLEFLRQLDIFRIQYCSLGMAAHVVGQWATAMNCSAYDAVYIQLARLENAKLASSDKVPSRRTPAMDASRWFKRALMSLNSVCISERIDATSERRFFRCSIMMFSPYPLDLFTMDTVHGHARCEAHR